MSKRVKLRLFWLNWTFHYEYVSQCQISTSIYVSRHLTLTPFQHLGVIWCLRLGRLSMSPWVPGPKFWKIYLIFLICLLLFSTTTTPWLLMHKFRALISLHAYVVIIFIGRMNRTNSRQNAHIFHVFVWHSFVVLQWNHFICF